MNFQCNHGKFCAVDKDNTVAASAKKVTWNCKQNSTWPLGGNQISGLSYANPPNQPPLASSPKGWQNAEPSHGEMEIGCAQIATIITTHLEHGATGVRRQETCSMSYSCEFLEDLEFCSLQCPSFEVLFQFCATSGYRKMKVV
ncbi:hypothetical protein Peur_029988 [Populus x canadensis]